MNNYKKAVEIKLLLEKRTLVDEILRQFNLLKYTYHTRESITFSTDNDFYEFDLKKNVIRNSLSVIYKDIKLKEKTLIDYKKSFLHEINYALKELLQDEMY
jgi:hypothetical protein